MDPKQQRDFLKAVLKGDLIEVVNLLSAGVEPDVVSSAQETALMLAINKSHEAVADLLVGYGANLEKKDMRGQSALHLACHRGNAATCELLILAGASTGSVDLKGQTPLFQAAEGGHNEVIKLLLEAGAKLEIRDKAGKSPLSLALARKRMDTISLFMQIGQEKDPNFLSSQGGEILVGAAEADMIELVDDLLAKGVSPNAVDGKKRTALMSSIAGRARAVFARMKAAGASVDAVDSDGNSAAMIAATIGEDAILDELADLGANLSLTNKAGMSVIQVALEKGNESSVRTLIKRGVQISDKEKIHPNFSKFKLGPPPAVVPDVEITIDPNKFRMGVGAAAPKTAKGGGVPEHSQSFRNDAGQTHLMIAASKGSMKEVRKCVEEGADVNARDRKGTTPLIYAAISGHLEVCQFLLEKRANVNHKNMAGLTALACAATSEKYEVAQELVKRGAFADSKIKGVTPLMLVAGKGSRKMCELLVQAGADPRLKDGKGNTAIAYAESKGHKDLAKYLAHVRGFTMGKTA